MKIIQTKDEDYEQHSSGMKALIKSFHFVFIVLTIIIVGMFIWLFTFGGYFIVRPQEVVLVLRFGELVYKYTDDWHWIYPYPIDEIIRIPTNKLKLTTTLYLPQKDVQAFLQGPEGPEPPKGGPLVPGKDGYLFTGDANIIHTEWEMIYQVTKPEIYYIRTLCPVDPKQPDEMLVNPKNSETMGRRGPQTLLTTVLENTVLKITATEKIEDALYKNSSKYMLKVNEEFKKRVHDLDIGVTVDNVILKKRTVPASTIRAFHDVIEAESESAAKKERARAYAVKLKNQTDAQESKILADAEAYKKRVVSDVKSEAAYFNQIYNEYKDNKDSEIILVALFNDALSSVLSNVKDKYVIRNDPGVRQQVWLKLNPEPKYKKQEMKKAK